VSLAFQRIDPIKFTPYMDQCLRELETMKEYEADSLLVQLVRIQHLSERIAQLHAREHVAEDPPGFARAPMSAYFNAFQGELDRFKSSLPRHLRSNRKFISHYNINQAD
jgi:hypothetical protein